MKLISYILILILFCSPYIIGYATNKELHFSGMLLPSDGNNYLSLINQAKEGRVLFTNMFTSEDVPYLIVRPFYMIGGLIGGFLGIPSVIVYHILRIIGIIMLIFYLEKIIKLIFKKSSEQHAILITLLICIFASGFGFFLRMLTYLGIKGYGSIDLWIDDSNNFLIMLSHPHIIISVALMLTSVYYFLLWNREQKLKDIILSSLFAFVLGFEHLFDVITIYATIALFIILKLIIEKKIDKKTFYHLIIFGLITIIPFVYTYWLFTFFPSFESWNMQNNLETPKIPYVIAGYGLMFLAFLLALFQTIKNQKLKETSPEIIFLICWVISVFALIYSPFNIQRRFLEGVHIPLGIITGFFIFSIFPKFLKTNFKKKYFKRMVILVLFLLAVTNIYNFSNKLDNLDNGRGIPPYQVPRYLEMDEHQALLWLQNHFDDNLIVVSAYNVGNYIPGYMNHRVYLGHWAQTIDFETKTNSIINYYKFNLPLDYKSPKYVWYGIDEKRLNPDFKPLEPYDIVFQNEKVTIFKTS